MTSNPHNWPELPTPEPFYQLGPKTLRVPMTLHADNRKRLIDRLKGKAPSNSVVMLMGGKAVTRDDTDHEPVFRQESFFQWAFGVKEPDCYGTIDTETGRSTLFVPLLPAEYAVWMGRIKPLDYFLKCYAVDEVKYVSDMAKVLKEKAPTLLIMHGLNTDSGNFSVPVEFDGMADFTVDREILFPEICECRVIKTDAELEVMAYSAKISSDAHIEVMKHIRPGMSEFQMESVFRHHCYYHGGMRNMSYTCICGAGMSGATLHYGHAGAPNERVVEDGDICLFDMGAEYHCYASDITCSFPANGKFTADQRMIYESVLAASQAVMAAVKPGVKWMEMHRLAERVQLEGLKRGGLVKGEVQDMLDAGIGALFMPHGLGHLIGLDTHDVGGYPKGLERSPLPGVSKLRTGRTLEKNMALTIEPGIYFIEALLEKAFNDPVQSEFLVQERILQFTHFGGVRIEDDIYITENGMVNMTKVPRSVEDIEALMQSSK